MLPALFLLGFLAVIPAYGIGYLVNTLTKRWWLATAVYVVALVIVMARYMHAIDKIYALMLALIGLGALLSSVTVRSFQRGTYRKLF